MQKIYTCKYFAIWSKHTHVCESIFTLRSHANYVQIGILKGTHTCYEGLDGGGGSGIHYSLKI